MLRKVFAGFRKNREPLDRFALVQIGTEICGDFPNRFPRSAATSRIDFREGSRCKGEETADVKCHVACSSEADEGGEIESAGGIANNEEGEDDEEVEEEEEEVMEEERERDTDEGDGEDVGRGWERK